MLAFREYLYQQFGQENLSFYLCAERFLIDTPDEKLEKRAKKIYKTYFSPNAPLPLNIDYAVSDALVEDMKDPNRKMFEAAKAKILHILKIHWFPEFVTSDLYKACNENRAELKITGGSRERSKTMDNYDVFVTYHNYQDLDYYYNTHSNINFNNLKNPKKKNVI